MPVNAPYQKRFDAVLAYIEDNLEGDLSVETLSAVAHFSVFHFHRQFSAFVGVPVARYVQLMRLRRAAHRLAGTARQSVLEAALGAGFDSPEAFSRAFRRAFGVSPSVFRRAPAWQHWNAVFAIPHFSRSITMQVRIIDFAEVRLAALEHRGAPGQVSETVRRFIDWRQRSGQSPVATSRSFGIPWNNPDTTAPEDFCFSVCGELREALMANSDGVRELILPAGRCAVVRHVGSPDHIGETIYPIYRDWLPASGEELRDHPLFFHYLSIYPQTPLEQWQTDIHIPLR
ncbi:AraC family transcriptional regulator [Pantoea sp. Cy-639]|uniref:AraC family transcriptional regulator n=1 Tax=Pantoea sp. Cy-639 TaxID=2608360 RepID=UPI00141DFF76|nr:AraC family transcriptional regulator [Pantoea sp. Cy-639]NIF18444.1 AraC family transcriptional regulator [Pantoea sp. Cy-639]